MIGDKKIVLLFALFISALIKLSVVIVLNIEPASDSASYMMMAKTMMSTGHMDDGMGNVAYFSAGYPLFLIPFFTIFGDTAEVAQFVNVMLGIVSIWLIYLCALQVLPNWKWAVAPALIWATYPPALIYTEYVAKENLMIPLLLLQTLLLLRYPYSQGKSAISFALGVIFGMGLVVGPAIILTGLLIGFVLLITSSDKKNYRLLELNWAHTSACAFGCALILSPWLFYTDSKLGKPVLTTNGGFNLYLGNNANSTVTFVGIQDTPMRDEWHALHKGKG